MTNVMDTALVIEIVNVCVRGMDDVGPSVRKAVIEAFALLCISALEASRLLSNLLQDNSKRNARCFKTLQQAIQASGRDTIAPIVPQAMEEDRTELPAASRSSITRKSSLRADGLPRAGLTSKIATENGSIRSNANRFPIGSDHHYQW